MKITFQALCKLVGSTTGMKLPTAKSLRESGVEIVASASVGEAGQLTVYRNGFYIYRTESGSTVHAVDRCMEYIYEGDDALDASLLDDEVWMVRLALEGEDRLERNNNAREGNNHFSYSDDAVERNDLRDPRDFSTEYEERELLMKLMGCLTTKQQMVMQMFFVAGMTLQQIADSLGIRKQSVADQVRAIEKKIKKLYQTT